MFRHGKGLNRAWLAVSPDERRLFLTPLTTACEVDILKLPFRGDQGGSERVSDVLVVAVLICQGYYNTFSQAGLLKQQRFISSQS